MTTKNRKIETNGLDRHVTFVTAILVWLVVAFSSAAAEDFLTEFETPEVSWSVKSLPQDSTVTLHERQRGAGKAGGAEVFRIASKRENLELRLEHPLPEAMVIDELEASLWVKSNHEGFVLSVRIVLPEVRDPKTGARALIRIDGDKYETPNRWQQLKCRTTDGAVRDKMRLLRAELLRTEKAISETPKDMFVDRVVLKGPLPPGDTEVLFDNLALSPVVRHQVSEPSDGPDLNRKVVQTSDTSDSIKTHPTLPVEFKLHRFYVDGKPFFPRIVTGQGERPEVFVSAGMNVVFLPNYDNPRVTAPLRRHGLWITSIPPFARGTDGEPLEADDANPLPFQADTASVLFWMMGTRMTPDGRPRLTSWANQIRNADRSFNKRPIAADVIENERLCSRHVDLLGISRHVIHSNWSLVEYRDAMIQRRDQAWPDTFIWTWIQTEPAPTLVDLARKIESPPMLEPEQIRLQVYAALAAGCRGIGYWTTTPLDHDSPAARERLLALTQLNLELDLIEPWITSGGSPQLIDFNVDQSRAEQLASAKAAAEAASKAAPRIGFRQPKSKTETPSPTPDSKNTPKKPTRDLRAALFRSDRGALLLPLWLDNTAQFVPGPMSALNVSIVVPGAGETAAAWEITTTGQLRYLEREQALGGVKIKLPRFDQTAAVLVTANATIIDELNQKILSIQEQSAQGIVELAKLKMERIRQVHSSLPSEAVRHPEDARRLLGTAKLHLNESEAALGKQQYSEAAKAAGEALQYGRLVQYSDWEHAVRRLPNPTANPWALSFQSLPEYWRLTKQLARHDSLDLLENLLPSGEFEDIGTLVAEHWKPEQSKLDSLESSAELYGIAKQGRRSLRLSANPIKGEVVPKIISKPLVTVVSPAIGVHAGQVVKITGWAKIPQAISSSNDAAMIYDSMLGKPGAVRLKSAQDWQQFELVRPVPESQEMTITIALNGVGELFVDDLRIVAFEPLPDRSTSSAINSLVTPTKHSTLESLRRLNPLPRRP